MNSRAHSRLGALATAIALLGSLASLDAHALALGRLTVMSALGEPLRAEIDITDINAEETASLKASVASVDAFRAAGLEYTPAVAGLQVSLQKRADGRSFLRLSSSRPVTEPFVDLVLDASWSSGRVARDYTMLFDPPNLRQSGNSGAPIAPVAPILSRPAPLPQPPGGRTNVPPPPAAAAQPAPTRPTARARTEQAGPRPKAGPGGQQLVVKPGETAGKIAAQNKPANVSLDQMLLAMLRSNPEAFIAGNINRLKAGAVLDIPSTDEAGAVAASEASRTIVAQSRDFNDFRRKLAEGAPGIQPGPAKQQAGGKLEARVEDRAPAPAAPDKLTLSKGAVQSKAAAEDKIAMDRQAKEASDRVAELAKNIGDLNKAAGTAASVNTSKTPGVAAPLPGPVALPAPGTSAPAAAAVSASAAKAVTAAPAALLPASAGTAAAVSSTSVAATPTSTTVTGISPTMAPMTAASAPSAAASAGAAAPAVSASAAVSAASSPVARVVKKPALPIAPPPEPSLLEELTENPFVMPGLAALMLLIGGIVFFRFKKRGDAVQVDSSFLESRLQPDSFFGASGGQRIDTNENGATGSSLVYSPSQLDAAGDVDPVAEADVYLAYGRDLQAEEILKEAMRTTPSRVAIHSKLLEIYAKRRDIKGFETVAKQAFGMTRGEGPEWAYISELGRDLDSANPMYQPGSAAPEADGASQFNSSSGFGSSTMAQPVTAQPGKAPEPVDFDLDLDFSIGDEPVVAAPPLAPPAAVAVAAARVSPEPAVAVKVPQDPIFDGLDMDFSLDTAAEPKTSDEVAKQNDNALSARGLSFDVEAPTAAHPSAAAPAPAALDSGMLEFDLSSLSLDLPGATPSPEAANAPAAAAAAAEADDPLATKFALAEEFRALGDPDGARSLAEEVAAQASGSLKTKAQAFLNAL